MQQFQLQPLKISWAQDIASKLQSWLVEEKSMFDIWCERENPKLTGNLLASVHISSYSSISECTWDLNKSPHAN